MSTSDNPHSLTITYQLEGYNVLFCVRDSTEEALQAAVKLVEAAPGFIEAIERTGGEAAHKGRGPAPHPGGQATARQPEARSDAPLCPEHQQPMNESQWGDDAWFCPRKATDPDKANPKGYCAYRVKHGKMVMG